MDQLGIGVSIYFKLLKSIIILFIICFTFAIPLLSIYWKGAAATSVDSLFQNLLARSFLGNIGESRNLCKKVDLVKKGDDAQIEMRCPDGAFIQSLRQFGL